VGQLAAFFYEESLMNSILKERVYGGEFLLSDANGEYTRESITIGANQALKSGSVLGKILRGAASVVVLALVGNTGNGVLGAASADAGAPAGEYRVTITGGTFTTAPGAVVGVGNGVLTMANPAFDANTVKTGVYKVIFVEPAADAGAFIVEGPDGVVVGKGAVGVAFDGPVKFTIADGNQDFTAASYIPITVAAAVPANGLGAFQVTKPDGSVDGTGTVGTAYNGTINFTLADGDANFVVGDVIKVTVSYAVIAEEDQVCVAIDPAAHNGSEIFAAILWDEVTTPADETAPGAGVVRGPCEVIATRLDFGTLTDEQIAAVKVQIAAKGIVIR
jgi:hypothetical protein